MALTAQLRAAIRFYSSDNGRNLIIAHKVAASEALSAFEKAYSVQVPIALSEFNRQLQFIANESDSECTN